MASGAYDHLFRYIIVGDMAVGKSCILLQFTDHKFRYQHELTIGVEFGGKTLEIKNRKLKIQIWDTAGQEQFQAITRAYYKGAIGALLVYDITRRDTFDHITKWLNEVKTHGSKDIVCVLVGNKKDLEDSRKVTYEEGEQLAKINGIFFLETSAKTAENVNEVFLKTAEKILDNMIENGTDISPNKNMRISLDDDDDDKKLKKKKGCCGWKIIEFYISYIIIKFICYLLK